MNNPFRSLSGKESEAVSIMDNRELFSSNLPSKIFISAPHWSRDIKYMPLNYHDKVAVMSQNGYDIGAFELASELAEKLKWIAVLSNVSKLLIDYNKSLISKHIILYSILHKETIDSEYKEDKIKISMNELAQNDQRLDYYYLEYHKLIREVIEFLLPLYHIDIHTYEWISDYKPNEYKTKIDDIGIQLYSPINHGFYEMMKHTLETNNLKCFTDPYIPHLSHHQWGTLLLDSIRDYDLEGKHRISNVQISVPNYWAKDKEFRENLISVLVEGINEFIKNTKER